MRLVCVLLLILPGATSQQALPCRANDEDRAVVQAAELSVSLFQRSLAIVPADRSATGFDKVPNARLESGQLLHDELHLAKQARRDVFASLQQWDKHIDALEAQLSVSKHIEVVDLGQSVNASLQTPATLTSPTLYEKSVTNSRMGVLCLAVVLIMVYMARTISIYEASRVEKEMHPPWYLDAKCMSSVLGAGGFLWLLTGMIMFTEFMWFTDDLRHLTVVESIYVTTQIVTTIGYGDMTPTSGLGKVFMAFYALTGVAIIGTLLQQVMADLAEEVEDELESEIKSRFWGKYHNIVMNVMPIFACIAFGTAFYSLYPGENKTVLEAFYMTMITLLTIGFGAYHPVTQVGKLVGALWMLIGVAVMGSAIVSATQYLKNVQAKLQAQARALTLFREIDKDGSGTIDKMEFLNYEIARQGLPSKTADDAMAQFAKLDVDGNGTLDFREFKAYVGSL